ncbi:MAG: phosphate ABC transporter substrate-binding protein PstS [Cyanothece sp. SIO1E1]|nr:phosphate ABC transporter substrate-binding protein PstS [Cyanothece sp. SIO1E1]
MTRHWNFNSFFHHQFSRLTAPVSLAALMTGMVGMVACTPQTSSTIALNGAGASLPAPLYELWFSRYEQQNSGIQIDYDSVGSGAGIEQFLAQEVNFAATDVPLTPTEMAQFPAERGDVMQVPVAGSAVVLAYNLDGVEALQLSREAYCGIAAGEITTWNDPAIAAHNPDVDLPNLPITFVHRQDSSGTTYIFTNHLSAACDDWSAGTGKVVDWETGVAAPSNGGVTATIQQTEGAIGYVGFAYAEKHFMPMATLENQAGYFVEPSPNSAELAITVSEATNDLMAMVPAPSGADAYPIVGLTYVLLYENYPDTAAAEVMYDFLQWALVDGKPIADALGYAPLSQALVAQVTEMLEGRLVLGQLTPGAI